jgi:hypothetical protein
MKKLMFAVLAVFALVSCGSMEQDLLDAKVEFKDALAAAVEAKDGNAIVTAYADYATAMGEVYAANADFVKESAAVDAEIAKLMEKVAEGGMLDATQAQAIATSVEAIAKLANPEQAAE